MCGIIAGFSKTQDVTSEIMDQFQDQRHRGTNGFGVMSIKEDGSFDIKRATSEILACVDLRLTESKMVLFHHRIPTSSTNKCNQTHPIKVEHEDFDNDYYLIHNGVIRNTDDLFQQHIKEGYHYSTFEQIDSSSQYNDSESLAFEIAKFIEGKSKEVTAFGTVAFFIVQVNKKTQKVEKIFFGRNDGNPMNIHQSGGQVFLSSEGKGAEVVEDYLYSFSPTAKKFKISKTKMIIDETAKVVETYWQAEKKEEENLERSLVKTSTEIEEEVRQEQLEKEEEANTILQENEVLERMEEKALEAKEIIDDFMQELALARVNPYEIESRETLKQINIVMKEAIQEAQDIYIDTENSRLAPHTYDHSYGY